MQKLTVKTESSEKSGSSSVDMKSNVLIGNIVGALDQFIIV